MKSSPRLSWITLGTAAWGRRESSTSHSETYSEAAASKSVYWLLRKFLSEPLVFVFSACCPFSYYFDCCWSVSPLRDKHRFIPPSLGATYEFLDLEFALLITNVSHVNFKCSWKHAVPRLPTFQQYFSAKFVGQTDFSVLGAPASRLYLFH